MNNGGSRENRVRILKEVLLEVRNNIPPKMPVFVRVSANDFVDGGIDIKETIEMLSIVKDLIDVVDCSSGGLLSPRIDLFHGYQISYAEAVKRELSIPTVAVGCIESPDMAEEIIGNQRADIVALGRVLLRQPYWPMYAAHKLKGELKIPFQYERGAYQ